MDSKTIKRYEKKTTKQLIKIAEKWCNKYIRKRDEGKPCVSCKEFRTLEAGHFYSAGGYSCTRFNEKNIHGQCKKCNSHLSGNLNEYRRNITSRITQKDLDDLDLAVDYYRKNPYHWDRFALIEAIDKYKGLCK